MKQENEDKLKLKFPGLLKQMDWDMSKTCMCFGFDYEDGWYDITHDMLTELEKVAPNAELMQAKEKFGSLRVYVKGNSDAWDVVHKYEEISATVCEWCSSKDGVTTDGENWLKTLCKECRDA